MTGGKRMANQKHLDILKQGAQAWNEWRAKNSSVQIDLSYANLRDAQLNDAQLSYANLSYADFRDAQLSLTDLNGANLFNADLLRAYLGDANLNNADLSTANLGYANLREANLNGANLGGAHLIGANLSNAHLREANLDIATIGFTGFGDIDLSVVKNLETVKHEGPSTIGINTIIRSQGKIPEIFLRNAGVPDSIIEAIPSLVGSLKPIDYYSCFISYSSKDQDFAERLYADLQSKGVRCWFAPEDLKIGDKLRPRIDESIRLHDKLLIVLSEHSIASNWVAYEVERALNKEPQGIPNVLFPIRVDAAVMESKAGWAEDIKSTRHIGDFTRWKNHDDYQKAFSRLLRDLKAEA